MLREARDVVAQLNPLFHPGVIAVIGATEKPGSVGGAIFQNLLSFNGRVYPVNPKRETIFGVKAYPLVKDLPEQADLAVIITQANLVPSIIDQCGEAGISAAIIISGGMKEAGPEGMAIEREVQQKLAEYGIRCIGTNCLGVIDTKSGLNASFAKELPAQGEIVVISQSGALGTAFMDEIVEQCGLRAFVSIGTTVDVMPADLLDYFRSRGVKRFVLYLEEITQATIEAIARAGDCSIGVHNAANNEAAAGAAKSHTGAMMCPAKIAQAGLRQVGAACIANYTEFLGITACLSSQPLPQGSRVAIVTNGGGPGVLATGALIDGGCQLAKLSEETMRRLNTKLPSFWSKGNPVDVLGDALDDRFVQAVTIVAKDEGVDAIIVILTPQAMTMPTETAKGIVKVAQEIGKPIVTSWMGGKLVGEGRKALALAGIPNYGDPAVASRMVCLAWEARRGCLSRLAAKHDESSDSQRREKALALIQQVCEEGSPVFSERKSIEVFDIWGLPVNRICYAASPDEAVTAAQELGFPVAIKVESPTVTHKRKVGGVCLNVQTVDDVRSGFWQIRESVTKNCGAEAFAGVTIQQMVSNEGGQEILIGSARSVLGPTVAVGFGGSLVEVVGDIETGLAPLTVDQAQDLFLRTKVANVFRDKKSKELLYDLGPLYQVIAEFSRMVYELRDVVVECEGNPLLVTPADTAAGNGSASLRKIRVQFLDGRIIPELKKAPVSELVEIGQRNGSPTCA